jgi:type IV pilus assembly protein PilA
LGVGIKTQTQNYKYNIEEGSNPGSVVVNRAGAIKPALKSYLGIVATSEVASGDTTEVVTLAQACETKSPVLEENLTRGGGIDTAECPAEFKDLGGAQTSR